MLNKEKCLGTKDWLLEQVIRDISSRTNDLRKVRLDQDHEFVDENAYIIISEETKARSDVYKVGFYSKTIEKISVSLVWKTWNERQFTSPQ